jgi:uncharacterized membrane protein YqgA involved in biofilm formation
VIGGLLGCLLGSRVTERWKKLLNDLLGVSAMTMGIVLILKVKNLSPVILSLLMGGAIGEALQLEKRVNGLVVRVTERVLRGEAMSEAHLMQVATVMVLSSKATRRHLSAFRSLSTSGIRFPRPVSTTSKSGLCSRAWMV